MQLHVVDGFVLRQSIESLFSDQKADVNCQGPSPSREELASSAILQSVYLHTQTIKYSCCYMDVSSGFTSSGTLFAGDHGDHS